MKSGPKPKRLEPTALWIDGQECVGIPLTKDMTAIVDKADSVAVLQFPWIATKHSDGLNVIWYAARRVGIGEPEFGIRQIVTLHQFLMAAGSDVDHRNGNGLDCRRCNLRPATDSQNQGNARLRKDSTSGFKGVTFRAAKGNRRARWCARINDSGIRRQLGSFQNPVEAALAYNFAALQKWGEFARLNNITQRTNEHICT